LSESSAEPKSSIDWQYRVPGTPDPYLLLISWQKARELHLLIIDKSGHFTSAPV
jgi:hypothetical protein